ncbi:MlaC/ttg2D family ABC transporter substrate-binding protein [Methylomonas rivi]|uniref:ABC transporter substrate-binding protein n=1 Tax=Methylomonas rivi TaxID=2952226 RepID=A0ABT1U903_9GAMM|nr:ABC transporter substrate-binding protein [Methylomonas sp. WSC-6]MCQ8129874.1 ABC transporter substrate-binding protein [Methylomonas sp. WSC-6]
MKQYLNVLFILLFGFLANAGVPTQAVAADLLEPQKVIEDASSQLKVRMQDPGFTKDFRKITEFVHSVIYPRADFDLISSLVLGKMWKEASASEKEAFKKEFQTLLIRTYSRAFVEFKEWSVRFLPINADEDERKVMVKTEILQPGLQPIAVNYRMLFNKGEWKVYDILIEGVSLVTNYRTSFKNEVERTGSLQEVINQLAKRNTEALSSQNHS